MDFDTSFAKDFYMNELFCRILKVGGGYKEKYFEGGTEILKKS